MYVRVGWMEKGRIDSYPSEGHLPGWAETMVTGSWMLNIRSDI